MDDHGRELGAVRNALTALCACGVVVFAVGLALYAVHFGGSAGSAGMQAALALAGIGGAALLWNRSGPRTLQLVIAVALFARLALLACQPLQSNDVYRYLWDGRLLLHGIDPYVVPPAATQLQGLRAGDWLYPHIDWRAVPTLYPPFDLALFALGAALTAASHVASVVPLKAILLCGDLATIVLLVALLREEGAPLGRVALYAWNPLVIVEFALNGHEEGWAIAWLLATLLALRQRARLRAGAALAGAVLTKLYPAAFLPVLFARRTALPGAMACVALVVAAYAPFVLWNRDVFGFLHTFAFGYHFNDSLHRVLGTEGAAALFAIAIAIAIRSARAGVPPVILVLALETAYLIVSPNVYPWYVAVFVALLPVAPNAFNGPLRPLAFALVAWTALAPLAYLAPFAFANGSSADIALHVLEYAPLALALAVLAARNARRFVLLFAGASALGGCAASAHPATGDAVRGAAYYARNCSVCHTPTRTSFIGPDLSRVAGRRSESDLAHHIATAVPASAPLTPEIVRSLVAYFKASNERSTHR